MATPKRLENCKECGKRNGGYRLMYCSDICARAKENRSRAAEARVARKAKRSVPRVNKFLQTLKCLNPACDGTITGTRRSYCSEKCMKEMQRHVFYAETKKAPK